MTDDKKDNDKDKRDKSLLGRARRLAQRVPIIGKRLEDEDAPRMPVPATEAPTSNLPAPVEAILTTLVRTVGRRMADIVDLVSSRMLQLDEAAAELAAFVEDVTQRHGRPPVVRAVLRHNLLLNGTFLTLVEPLLRGETDEVELDFNGVQRGRDTVTELLIALARLDDEHGDELSEDELETGESFYGLGYLEDIGFDSRYPHVWTWLTGVQSEEQDARFLMGSYFIFLQTFLLRTAARGVAELPAGPRNRSLDHE